LVLKENILVVAATVSIYVAPFHSFGNSFHSSKLINLCPRSHKSMGKNTILNIFVNRFEIILLM